MMSEEEILENCYTVINRQITETESRLRKGEETLSGEILEAHKDNLTKELAWLEKLRRQVYFWKSTGELLGTTRKD